MKNQYNILTLHDISNKNNTKTITHILFYNKTIIYYLSLQLQNFVCFISRLDSTGYSKKCKSKDFVFTILKKYNYCNLIYCLSKSTPCFVFRNLNKNVLDNSKLIKLWKTIFCQFNESKINIVNTQSSENCLSEFVDKFCIFDDDPISKILSHGLNLDHKKLFKILCCRSDFVESSYIFSIKDSNEKDKSKKHDELEVDKDTKRTKFIKVEEAKDNFNIKDTDIKEKENFNNCKEDLKNDYANIDKKENIYFQNIDIVNEFLLSLDFNDDSNIEQSSKKFIQKFKFCLEPFKLFKCINNKNEKIETIMSIKGKRIR